MGHFMDHPGNKLLVVRELNLGPAAPFLISSLSKSFVFCNTLGGGEGVQIPTLNRGGHS